MLGRGDITSSTASHLIDSQGGGLPWEQKTPTTTLVQGWLDARWQTIVLGPQVLRLHDNQVLMRSRMWYISCCICSEPGSIFGDVCPNPGATSSEVLAER